MKLHELTTAVKNNEELSYEQIAPYKKSLYVYFKDYFCFEPVCMITFVTNALQGCKIVSENIFLEELEDYLQTCHLDSEEEFEAEKENILFNSKLMKEIL